MLLNYITLSKYDIDIDNLIDFYKRFKVLKPIDSLVSNWLDVIRYAYLHNKCSITYDKNKPCKYYQQLIKIPDIAEFYIHFNIDKAVEISKNYQLQTLNSRLLIHNNVEFEPQQDLKNYHFTCEAPIIIVDFPCKLQSEKMVIDGNHRMTAKVLKNRNVRFANFYPNDTVLIIPQTFEQAWYLFAIELNDILKLKSFNQKTDFIDNKSVCEKFFTHISSGEK